MRWSAPGECRRPPAAASALQQRGQAIRQRNAAIISQLTTDESQLKASDPSLAAQLTLVAHRMQSASPEFDSNLIAAENTTLSTPLTGHTGQVWAVAFSRTGHVLATGGRDGTVQLWNVADPARPRTFGPPVAGREGIIWSVAFSPDGRTLASGPRAERSRELTNCTKSTNPSPEPLRRVRRVR